MNAERIAMQVWTVRDQQDVDPTSTLHRIAEIGYPAVELVYSRTGGLSHDRQRTICDEVGLRVAAMHCFYDDLDAGPEHVAEAAQALGTHYVVCAWMDAEQRRSAATYQAAADVFESAGGRLAELGLQLGYHHHDFELALVEGRRGIDYLWDVDPALLVAEVDTYWVHEAGLDVVDYLQGLGDRAVLLHCKDRAPSDERPLGPEGEGLARFNCEVGEGVINFPPILAAAASAQWLVTEQDFSDGDPFTAAETSLHNLRQILAGTPPA